MDTLAKRVRDQRKALGMTQAQLAHASGLQQSDISKIENGKVQSTTAVVELAIALNKPPEWLRFAGYVAQEPALPTRRRGRMGHFVPSKAIKTRFCAGSHRRQHDGTGWHIVS